MTRLLVCGIILVITAQAASLAFCEEPDLKEIRERIIRLEEGQKAINKRMDDMGASLNTRMEDLKSSLNGRMDDLLDILNREMGLLRWLILILIAIGLVPIVTGLRERKAHTGVDEIKKQMKELQERMEKLQERVEQLTEKRG